MSQSLYRKYRPNTFSQVVGQGHIITTLCNAVATDAISHAYLFCGPRGTGKTTTARLLAKALLCENAPTDNPCGTCDLCQAIAQGAHPDVYELDAASRTGVDNVRDEIISRVQFAPTQGSYKIYIIDEVHMLSVQAFNALLKTLEEPPSHVVFILCTTDPQKIPATILSRCQRYDFHRLTVEELKGNLEYICNSEGFEFEDEALALIAGSAQGGMRDAITTLEQVATFGGNKVGYSVARDLLGNMGDAQLFQLMDLIAARDTAACLTWVNSFLESGADVAQLARDLTYHARDLYVVALTGGEDGLVIADAAKLKALKTQAGLFQGTQRMANMLEVLSQLLVELRTATDARLALELALVRIARPDSDLSLESLAERVEALETGGLARAFSQPHTLVVANTAAMVEGAPVVMGAQTQASAQQQAGKAGAQAQAQADDDPVAQQPVVATSAQPETAPEPEPQPVAPAVADSSQLAAVLADDAAVQRLWTAVAREAKNQKKSLTAVFGGTRARGGADGKTLIVELPADAGFALRTLKRPETHQLVSDIVAQIFAVPLAIDFVLAGETSQADLIQAQPAVAQPTTQPAAAAAAAATAATTAVAASEPAAPAEDDEYVFEDEDDDYYDEVPLSAYDEFDGGAVSVEASAKDAASSATPTIPSDQGPEAKNADASLIAQMLSNSFGSGVVFEED